MQISRTKSKVGHTAAVLLATLLFLNSCAPSLPDSPSEQMVALSKAALRPEITCKQLRDTFNLRDLPMPSTPDEVGMPYEEYRVPAPDGAELRVWYIRAPADRGNVIISIGNSGNIACYWWPAKLLFDRGWSVVLYDYEGYGGSSGAASLLSLTPDLAAVAAWASATTAHPRATLYGISYGVMPSIAVAAGRPDLANGVIADAPVVIETLIFKFGRLVTADPQALVDLLPPDLRSFDVIRGMSQPLLMFLHGADIVSPPSVHERLFDNAPGPKRMVRFPGLQHSTGQFLRTDEFIGAIEAFLEGIAAEGG